MRSAANGISFPVPRKGTVYRGSFCEGGSHSPVSRGQQCSTLCLSFQALPLTTSVCQQSMSPHHQVVSQLRGFRVMSATPLCSRYHCLGVKQRLIPLRSEQDNGEDATHELKHCQWPSRQLGPCQHLQLGRQSASAILSAWAMVATRGAEKAGCQQTWGQAGGQAGCSSSQHTAREGVGCSSGSSPCSQEPAQPSVHASAILAEGKSPVTEMQNHPPPPPPQKPHS